MHTRAPCAGRHSSIPHPKPFEYARFHSECERRITFCCTWWYGVGILIGQVLSHCSKITVLFIIIIIIIIIDVVTVMFE